MCFFHGGKYEFHFFESEKTLKSRKVEEEKENESNNKMEIKDIMKNVNKLIGKKRRGKVICDEDEDNEENFQDDKSLNSFISANTIISRNRIKKDNKKGKGKSLSGNASSSVLVA